MSNRDPNEPLQIVPDNYRSPPEHIARNGEREFAVIYRARSGLSAGDIDCGVCPTSIQELSEAEQRDIIVTAEVLLRSVRDACDKVPQER